MGVRPISVEALVEELAEAISARSGWVRVAVDGADAARPWELADQVAERLRVRRHVLRVSAGDFLRPASLRYEFGKQDPDSYYDGWLDVKGLTREVLQPLDPGGTDESSSLWDPVKDRATARPISSSRRTPSSSSTAHCSSGRGFPSIPPSTSVCRRALCAGVRKSSGPLPRSSATPARCGRRIGRMW